jgi:hypothetical protein
VINLESSDIGVSDHAMKSIITKPDSAQPVTETAAYLFDDWFDTIELWCAALSTP